MNSSEVCSVCTGDNMPNCICGGTGTAFGETQGLREECFRLREEIEKYQRAIDKQKDRCKKLRTIASDLKDQLRVQYNAIGMTVNQILRFRQSVQDPDTWKNRGERQAYRDALEVMKMNGLIKAYSLDGIYMPTDEP
jgi:predicted RNase H-like nuclease (RuvC/YqgF family)